LPEVGVVLLSGQPKRGKSIVALDICGSVMTGLDAVTRKVTRRGGVLFVALPTEGNDEVPIRLRGLVEGKLRTEAVDAPAGYLDKLPFAWLREGENDINLQDKASVSKVLADIDEAADHIRVQYGLPLALIVIDALEAAGKFGDGYKSNEAKRVMTVCDQIAAHAKCCILVLDHFGKDEDQGTLGSIHKEGGVKLFFSFAARPCRRL
jgi:RecA-family ATPase